MNYKILFIEDERSGVRAYLNALERKGIECFRAKNGDEAIHLMQEKKFDIISLDVMFPPGNILGANIEPRKAGFELLKRIRHGKIKNCNPGIKVIVLTAVIDTEIENSIRILKVNHYLKKPISFSNVLKTIMSLLRE